MAVRTALLLDLVMVQRKPVPALLRPALHRPVEAAVGVGPIDLPRNTCRHLRLETDGVGVNIRRSAEHAAAALAIRGEGPEREHAIVRAEERSFFIRAFAEVPRAIQRDVLAAEHRREHARASHLAHR